MDKFRTLENRPDNKPHDNRLNELNDDDESNNDVKDDDNVDLDYISKPENYTGSSQSMLQYMQQQQRLVTVASSARSGQTESDYKAHFRQSLWSSRNKKRHSPPRNISESNLESFQSGRVSLDAKNSHPGNETNSWKRLSVEVGDSGKSKTVRSNGEFSPSYKHSIQEERNLQKEGHELNQSSEKSTDGSAGKLKGEIKYELKSNTNRKVEIDLQNKESEPYRQRNIVAKDLIENTGLNTESLNSAAGHKSSKIAPGKFPLKFGSSESNAAPDGSSKIVNERNEKAFKEVKSNLANEDVADSNFVENKQISSKMSATEKPVTRPLTAFDVLNAAPTIILKDETEVSEFWKKLNRGSMDLEQSQTFDETISKDDDDIVSKNESEKDSQNFDDMTEYSEKDFRVSFYSPGDSKAVTTEDWRQNFLDDCVEKFLQNQNEPSPKSITRQRPTSSSSSKLNSITRKGESLLSFSSQSSSPTSPRVKFSLEGSIRPRSAYKRRSGLSILTQNLDFMALVQPMGNSSMTRDSELPDNIELKSASDNGLQSPAEISNTPQENEDDSSDLNNQESTKFSIEMDNLKAVPSTKISYGNINMVSSLLSHKDTSRFNDMSHQAKDNANGEYTKVMPSRPNTNFTNERNLSGGKSRVNFQIDSKSNSRPVSAKNDLYMKQLSQRASEDSDKNPNFTGKLMEGNTLSFEERSSRFARSGSGFSSMPTKKSVSIFSKQDTEQIRKKSTVSLPTTDTKSVENEKKFTSNDRKLSVRILDTSAIRRKSVAILEDKNLNVNRRKSVNFLNANIDQNRRKSTVTFLGTDSAESRRKSVVLLTNEDSNRNRRKSIIDTGAMRRKSVVMELIQGEAIRGKTPSLTGKRSSLLMDWNRDFILQRAKKKVRRVAKVITIVKKWLSFSAEKSSKPSEEPLTFTDLAESFCTDDGLNFDLSYFKANKEISLTSEVKTILSTPNELRTPEQIKTAIYGLQSLKSFTDYPLHMQEKFCKAGWYQRVPPRRVIIRQGHLAENFYFILTGSALVKFVEQLPNGETQIRTAGVLGKGGSFGELALLHHSRRTATVVSQDHPVQLLTISRDDFYSIIMGKPPPGQLPEHIEYLSTLEFMEFWPIEKLLENPETCMFHFFKTGTVIVKDSGTSDWLYVIKTGSCRVIKQLKPARPRTASQLLLTRYQGYSPELSAAIVKLKSRSASEDIQEENPDQEDQLKSKFLHELNQEHNDEHKQEQGSTATSSNNAASNQNSTTYINLNNHVQNKNSITPKEPDLHNTNQMSLRHSNAGRISPNKYAQKSESGLGVSGPTSGLKPSPFRSVSALSTRSGLSRGSRASAGSKGARSGSDSRVSGVRPGTSSSGYLSGGSQLDTMDPVFVQLELLKPGDVFGLRSLSFEEKYEDKATSVTLISNGAECILLSKRCYMEHANAVMRCRFRKHFSPYPTDVALQSRLQDNLDWDSYKEKLITRIVDSNVHVKEEKNQILANVQGGYLS